MTYMYTVRIFKDGQRHETEKPYKTISSLFEMDDQEETQREAESKFKNWIEINAEKAFYYAEIKLLQCGLYKGTNEEEERATVILSYILRKANRHTIKRKG